MEKAKPIDVAQPLLIQREGPRLLTVEEQQVYLELLLSGASPMLICKQMGVAYAAVRLTLEESANFQRDFEDVLSLRDQNIETALYHAALKGSIPAQSLWLKNRPPPHWKIPEESMSSMDELGQISDEELVERARTEGIVVPTEIESRVGRSDG